ncbi:MAG: FAD-binding protein [Phycisphaera sp. RhM]|nr:FAD-binding protein [Phycisphaera sp. RhM]
MSELVDVETIAALQELVRHSESILVIGNRTKPALSSVAAPTQLVTTRSLSGIIEYEPSEFTFTALAGTTLAEIKAALAAKNQYLPFDPFLAETDATADGNATAGAGAMLGQARWLGQARRSPARWPPGSAVPVDIATAACEILSWPLSSSPAMET